jgi:hypothetical protein
MAGSFTSPTGAPPKMKVGKVNRPKRTSPTGSGVTPHPEYPITDSFASESIPGFASRHKHTNNKSGFNTVPGRPPAGRLAQHAPAAAMEVGVRGTGKEVGRDERKRSGDSHGVGGSQEKA